MGLVLALLQLVWPMDLTATNPSLSQPPGHGGLHLVAHVDHTRGRLVAAQLVNDGNTPVEVLLGYSCGGPEPFQMIENGVSRSFQTGKVVCTGNSFFPAKLAPGAGWDVPSRAIILDENEHTIRVSYTASIPKLWTGTLVSAPIHVSATDFTMRLIAKAAPNHAVEVELVHVWRGNRAFGFLTRWIGVCASPADELFVDDLPYSFIENACDGPTAAVEEPLTNGEFVNRATIHLRPGRHRLRASYRITEETLRVLPTPSSLPRWVGFVSAPEVEIEVR